MTAPMDTTAGPHRWHLTAVGTQQEMYTVNAQLLYRMLQRACNMRAGQLGPLADWLLDHDCPPAIATRVRRLYELRSGIDCSRSYSRWELRQCGIIGCVACLKFYRWIGKTNVDQSIGDRIVNLTYRLTRNTIIV